MHWIMVHDTRPIVVSRSCSMFSVRAVVSPVRVDRVCLFMCETDFVCLLVLVWSLCLSCPNPPTSLFCLEYSQRKILLHFGLYCTHGSYNLFPGFSQYPFPNKCIPFSPLPTPPHPFLTVLVTQEPCGSDAGKYKCVAMNQFGEATANVNLNIEADPEPKGQAPVFVEKPTIKFEEKAGRVLMEAVVRADPQPTSRWTKDARELDGSRVTATVTREKEECYRIRLELRVTWQPAPSSLPNSPAGQPGCLSHASQSAYIMHHHHACLALVLLPAYVWPISYLCSYNILFFFQRHT